MSELEHDYDPAKRREYYLRNRKLKGRSKHHATVSSNHRPRAKKTAAERNKEIEARIARLKNKLEKLQAALKALTEAAQKRSGIDKNSAEKKDSKDRHRSTQERTQKQKDAAAKAAKEYRKKHHSGLEGQVEDLNNKIKAIRERIKRLQKTGSVGASKLTSR